MSAILDAPSQNSIVLPLSVEICHHPEGGRWSYGDGGIYADLRVHLDASVDDHDQLMAGVADIIRRAMKQTGTSADGIAFIDIRYVGDFSRGFTLTEDDEGVGPELERRIDRYFYKNKLYFSPEYADRNSDPEMLAYVSTRHPMHWEPRQAA